MPTQVKADINVDRRIAMARLLADGVDRRLAEVNQQMAAAAVLVQEIQQRQEAIRKLLAD